MAGHLDPTRAPSATHTAPARGTGIAEFAAPTYGYRGSSYLDLWRCSVVGDAVWRFFGVHSPSPHRVMRAGVMSHVPWFGGAQAQALNPQAKSPWKISTTITSPRAAS